MRRDSLVSRQDPVARRLLRIAARAGLTRRIHDDPPLRMRDRRAGGFFLDGSGARRRFALPDGLELDFRVAYAKPVGRVTTIPGDALTSTVTDAFPLFWIDVGWRPSWSWSLGAYGSYALRGIIEAVRAHGMECTIVTGGRGLTEERARAAKRAGLTSASVSIDGLASTHDAVRAMKGSHDAALAAMDRLARAGVPVSANTQIGRDNRRELESLFQVIAAANAHSWQLQLTVAAGRVTDEPCSCSSRTTSSG